MTTKPENQTLINLLQFLTFDEIAEMYDVSKDKIMEWKISMMDEIHLDYFKSLKVKIKNVESDYQNILTNIKTSLVKDLNICPIPIYFFNKEIQYSDYTSISKIYCRDKNAIDYVNSLLNLKVGYIIVHSLKQYKDLRRNLVDRHDIIVTDFSYDSFIMEEIVKETENLNLYD